MTRLCHHEWKTAEVVYPQGEKMRLPWAHHDIQFCVLCFAERVTHKVFDDYSTAQWKVGIAA